MNIYRPNIGELLCYSIPLHSTYHIPTNPIKLAMNTQGSLNCLSFPHLLTLVLILAPPLADSKLLAPFSTAQL